MFKVGQKVVFVGAPAGILDNNTVFNKKSIYTVAGPAPSKSGHPRMFLQGFPEVATMEACFKPAIGPSAIKDLVQIKITKEIQEIVPQKVEQEQCV